MKQRIAAGALTIAAVTAPMAGAWPAPAGAAVRAGSPAPTVRLTSQDLSHLRALYAAQRHLPLSDVSQVSLALAARAPGGQTWAMVKFEPPTGAAQQVQVAFQDGAGTGVFTHTAGSPWALAGLGGEPAGCGVAIPPAVRGDWHLGACTPASPSPAPPVPGSPRSGTVGGLINIAQAQVGVRDNPSETSFSGLDCNPYTTLVGVGQSSAGCGRTSNSGYFTNIQDESELWCADFTKYVWEKAGVTTGLGTLTPAASSFYAWGKAQGERLVLNAGNPEPGDAVVLYAHGVNPASGAAADHVGIIAAVHSNGSVTVVNGDFGPPSPIGVYEQTWPSVSNYASSSEAAGEEWVFVSPRLAAGSADAPTAAADSADNQYVFWKGANDGLWETHYTAAGNHWSAALEVPNMGPLGSAPTVALGPMLSDGSAEQFVYWQGTDGNLYQAYYDGSWHGPANLGDGPLGSRPAAAVDSAGNRYVFWTGTGGDLWETHYAPATGKWTLSHFSYGPLGSRPTVATDNSGHQYVFWAGTGGALWEAQCTGATNTCTGPYNLGDGPLGSAPAAGVDSAGNRYVFWEGTGGDLWETHYTASSGSWSSLVHLDDGPLGSAPTVAIGPMTSSGSPTQYVFWAGTDLNLWEAWWTGTQWNGPLSLGDGPLG